MTGSKYSNTLAMAAAKLQLGPTPGSNLPSGWSSVHFSPWEPSVHPCICLKKGVGAWFCNWSATRRSVSLAQAKKRHSNLEGCDALVYLLWCLMHSSFKELSTHLGCRQVQMPEQAWQKGLEKDRCELIKLFHRHGEPEPSKVYLERTSRDPAEKSRAAQVHSCMPFICLLYDLLGIPWVFFTVHCFVAWHRLETYQRTPTPFKDIGMKIRHSQIVISRLWTGELNLRVFPPF